MASQVAFFYRAEVKPELPGALDNLIQNHTGVERSSSRGDKS